MRSLNELEKNILSCLLEKDFPGKDAIIKQLENVKVSEVADGDNYGSILLHTDAKEVAAARNTIPVEALVVDTDGIDVAILLHVVDGFVSELEFFKVDGSPMIESPNPQLMRIQVA